MSRNSIYFTLLTAALILLALFLLTDSRINISIGDPNLYTAIGTLLLAAGTFYMAVVTSRDYRRRRELEEKRFLGSVGIRLIKSGTINILNNSEYPIKLISCVQRIDYCEPVDWRYENEPYPIISSAEYARAERSYIRYLKNENQKWDGEMLLDMPIDLDPKEQVSLDDSLAYNLFESDSEKDYFAVFLWLRLKWQDEKIRGKQYLFRYSAYKSPQGWVRVG